MIERTARKAHRCDDYRWRKRVGLPLLCSGTIEPGQRYAESPEDGEPFHPSRNHLECYRSQTEPEARP
jgi:hypothetical protein